MSLKNVRTVVITGNTFACKEDIKKLGGRWDAERKAWIIDITGHPSNTMRGRSGLDSALRALEQHGCHIEHER
jgi:hypothetical protein